MEQVEENAGTFLNEPESAETNDDVRDDLNDLLSKISELFCGIKKENTELWTQNKILWEIQKNNLKNKAVDSSSCISENINASENNNATSPNENEYIDDDIGDEQDTFNVNSGNRKNPGQMDKNERLGLLYEQYVGYCYERLGYRVKYNGIEAGLEDGGIDLICKNHKQTLVVQCKKWSAKAEIHENHICQFFGAASFYKKTHPNETVRAVFVTTTFLSERAREYAKKLSIYAVENFQMKWVKCKFMSGDKVYYTPRDDEYFEMKINYRKGDMYCKTTKEAEGKGFKRKTNKGNEKNVSIDNAKESQQTNTNEKVNNSPVVIVSKPDKKIRPLSKGQREAVRNLQDVIDKHKNDKV